MDNTFGMRESQTPENILKNRQGFVFGQFTFCSDKLAKILAVHEFHNKKKLSLGFEKIGNLNNIWMIEDRLPFSLLIKSATKLRITIQRFRKAFDRKTFGKLYVLRQVDNSHPALADF